MTTTLTAWLLLSMVLGAVAWFSTSRTTVAFLLAVPVAFFVTQIPLGHPDYDTPPVGSYAVLGARIDVDVAIYAMLDGPCVTGSQCEPHLYRLPYSEGTANDLQAALDEGEGGVEAEIQADGDPVFHALPVTSGEDKQAETPMMGME